MDFKIVEIKEGSESFTVTIEIIETMERRGYSFPIGQGWEDKEKGEYKFMKNIKARLERIEKAKAESIVSTLASLKGNVFKTKQKKEHFPGV